MNNKKYFKYTKSPWDYILPDGQEFCHWGGKATSKLLLKDLGLQNNDCVLDVCCGEAGTLSMAQSSKASLHGIDISQDAIIKAQKKYPSLKLSIESADTTSFEDEYFTKIFSQDPDCFLNSPKNVLKEWYRIASQGAELYIQTYCVLRKNAKLENSVNSILSELGYVSGHVVEASILLTSLEETGFSVVGVKSLHEEYSRDNVLMISRLYKFQDTIREEFGDNTFNIFEKLLNQELELFSKRVWTGMLFRCQK